MIGHITHGVKKFFIWAFLITISVVFIFWGSYGLRLGTSQYIDVNGQKVYPQEINVFKRVYPEADLIQITLGMQELNKIGFNLSDRQVDNIIRSYPIFQSAGQFSNEQYQAFLSRNLAQLQAMRKGAYFNNLVQQMTYSMQQAIVPFPSTTESYYRLMDQKRNISMLTVSQKKFLNEIKTDTKELENYYNENKLRYTEPAKVKLEYIRLNYPDVVKQIKVNNSDIEEYYKQNQEQFTKAGRKHIAQIVIDMKKADAKQKLDNVQLALKENKDFGAVAKEYSDDILTAKKSGDAGWFQVGDMGESELDEALVVLSKSNNISPVITANEKWYIFKLLEQKSSSKLPLAEVKETIRTKISEDRANTIYSDLKNQLERKSFEIADSLAIVAEEMELKTFATDWINKEGLVSSKDIKDSKSDKQSMEQELAENQKVIEAAFSEDVLENRNNSQLIELNTDSAVVVRIKDYQPSRTKLFTEVSKEVETAVKEIKARNRAREYAGQLWQDFINNTATMSKLEKIGRSDKYADFQKPKDISYLDTFWNNNGDISREITKAFDLPKPNDKYPLQAKLLTLDNGDQSILAIDKVTLGEFASASEEQKIQTANQLKYYMLMRDNANFFNRVFSNAEVKRYM